MIAMNDKARAWEMSRSAASAAHVRMKAADRMLVPRRSDDNPGEI